MEPQAVRDAQIAGWDAAPFRVLQENARSEVDDEDPGEDVTRFDLKRRLRQRAHDRGHAAHDRGAPALRSLTFCRTPHAGVVDRREPLV